MTQTILDHHIPRPVDEVYPYLSDIERFVSMHPVIYKCEHKGGTDHVLYERLRVLGIGISFSYPVCIQESIPNERVVMFSEFIKGVNLRLVFDLTCNGETTTIKETILFKGPFFVRPMFMRLLARMHSEMMTNIGQGER